MGRTGRVTEAVGPGHYGRVAIDGDVWKAETQGQRELPAGTPVRVVGRKSIIISVTELQTP